MICKIWHENCSGAFNSYWTYIIWSSGAHTIGKARCTVFRDRIYNETNIDPSYAKSLQANCPRIGGDNNLSPLDNSTIGVDYFDNGYYKDLVNKRGLLHSDQQLFNGGSTDSQVKNYMMNPLLFKSDFAKAMVKMGKLSPLIFPNGQIRKQCSRVNWVHMHPPLNVWCLEIKPFWLHLVDCWCT